MFHRLSKDRHRKLAKIREAEGLPSSHAALERAIDMAAILVDDEAPAEEPEEPEREERSDEESDGEDRTDDPLPSES